MTSNTMLKFKILNIMIFVVFVSVALAGMRNATAAVASAALWLVYCALVMATLGSVVRGRGAGAWRGFALFGWAYFLPVFAFATKGVVDGLPTSRLLVSYVVRTTRRPQPHPGVILKAVDTNSPLLRGIQVDDSYVEGSADIGQMSLQMQAYNAKAEPAYKVGQVSMTILLACIGAIVGWWLDRPHPRASGRRRHRDLFSY